MKADILDVKDAFAAMQDAQRSYAEILQMACPVGTRIEWRRGAHPQTGTVLMHDHWRRVKVRNDNTGSEFWLHAHHITGYAKEAANG
jgi:hypothetical protein